MTEHLIIKSKYATVTIPMEQELALSLEQDGIIEKTAVGEYAVVDRQHSKRDAERLMFMALYARS